MFGLAFCIIPVMFINANITTAEKLFGIFIILFFSLLPDLDHPISKITWWMIGCVTIANLLSYFFAKQYLLYGILLQAAIFIIVNLGHRGPVHSIAAGVLFSLPLFFLFANPIFAILAIFAFWSHLIADGIPLKLR